MGYEKIVTLAERCAKYAATCGKRSILETKPLGKVNFSELGVCLSDGTIHFQNEESAVKYIFKRLHKALDLPQEQQFERVIAKRGTTIIGEGDGTHTSATKEFANIKGMMERMNSDVPRDLEVYHSHPDMFGTGRTTPLSGIPGDIGTFFNFKLKKIVAVNSKGEFNSLEIGNDFSLEKFKMFEEKYEDVALCKLLGTEQFKEFKKIQKIIKSLTPGERLKGDIKGQYDRLIEQLSKREKATSKTGEIAIINHEANKCANDFGMKYDTNFSNLLEYEA